MAFRLMVKASGESTFCGNGLVFATKEEATRYGMDLWSRWTLVEEMRVDETDAPVNQTFDEQGRMVGVK